MRAFRGWNIRSTRTPAWREGCQGCQGYRDPREDSGRERGRDGNSNGNPVRRGDKVAETVTEETGATGGKEMTVEGLSQQESAAVVQKLLAFARTHGMLTPLATLRRVGLPTQSPQLTGAMGGVGRGNGQALGSFTPSMGWWPRSFQCGGFRLEQFIRSPVGAAVIAGIQVSPDRTPVPVDPRTSAVDSAHSTEGT